MPSPISKTLSPAELAKLEHAFATDPASDSYKPLAEAYLGMGRFMEAMVVCKKGVKAHPNDAEPRLLLARVYAEQGKDKKALEELQGALQIAPTDKAALRMTGALQMKVGETEAGKANLLRSAQLDPNDEETRALLTQWKLDEAAAPSAPPAVEVTAVTEPPRAPASTAPVAGPGARAHAGLAPTAPEPAPVSAKPAAAPVEPQPAPEREARPPLPVPPPAAKPKSPNGAHGRAVTTSAPAASKAPRAGTAKAPAQRRQEFDEEYADRGTVAAPRRGSKKLFFVLLGLMLVVPATYMVVGRYTAIRNREIRKLLANATDEFKHDSYDSYKKACALADKVLELNASSTAAHGYLAYAYAIRWGEHGGGDDARKMAEEHLESARKGNEVSSHFFAAEALVRTYAGKGAEALKELEQRVKAFDAEGRKSSLMYLTLGLIQMNHGDLEHALESLKVAQTLAPDDARTYSAMGTLFRRRGLDQDAWRNFDFALRYEKDHPESMLGKSLVVLDQDDPGRSYVVAGKMLKKLLETDPPPSPRQLASANLARALLLSRVSKDLPLYTDAAFRKELSDATGVGGDREKVKAEITKAEETGFSLDRDNPELNLIKGKRLFYEDNIDGAAAELRKAVTRDGSRAHFHVELARVLMKKEGGLKEAEGALRTAVRMNPGSPKLAAMLGHVLYRQGKLDEALVQYEKSVNDPGAKNPEARMQMGRIYRDRNDGKPRDLSRAIGAFDKAVQEYMGQTLLVAQAYDELGQTHELANDKAKAREAYDNSIRADNTYVDAYCHAARLASAMNDRARAKALAGEYMRQAASGACAPEMKRLGG